MFLSTNTNTNTNMHHHRQNDEPNRQQENCTTPTLAEQDFPISHIKFAPLPHMPHHHSTHYYHDDQISAGATATGASSSTAPPAQKKNPFLHPRSEPIQVRKPMQHSISTYNRPNIDRCSSPRSVLEEEEEEEREKEEEQEKSRREYNRATWRMYHRITRHRTQHQLVGAYNTSNEPENHHHRHQQHVAQVSKHEAASSSNDDYRMEDAASPPQEYETGWEFDLQDEDMYDNSESLERERFPSEDLLFPMDL